MRYGVAVLAALALAPADAGAATRFVSPMGAGSGACARVAPCSVAWALNGDGSHEGDTVRVLEGTYTDQPVFLTRRLSIAGRQDGARPVFRTTTADGAAFTVGAGAAGTVVAHLAILTAGTASPAVDIQSPAALNDLQVTSATTGCLRSAARGLRIDDSSFVQTGAGSEPCLQTSGNDTAWTGVTASAPEGPTAATYAGNGTITDATFTAQVTGLRLTGSAIAHRVTAVGGPRGVELGGNTTLTDSVAVARTGGSAVDAGGGSHQVLNVTAWAVGEGSIGIHAGSGADVVVTNTIARGEAADLSADAAATDAADCVVDASCPAGQMTASTSNFRTGVGIRDAGANQSGDPSFVDAGALNFHLRPGSPAIDAGKPGFSPSSADRDDVYRWLGRAPDMGAYEYRAPRPQRPRGDVIGPVLTGLRLAPRHFRVARHGIAFSAVTPRRAGTILSFSLSEDADVVLLVSPARPHAEAIGAIVRGFVRGAHRMRISGASEHGFLPPGRYVLTVIGRDLAQNLSRARRITFVVTR